MKFAYKRFVVYPPSGDTLPRSVLRPVIPVHIAFGRYRIAYEALLDSGADYLIFHAEIGEALPLPVQQGERIVFSGVAGVQQDGFRHAVQLKVGRRTLTCAVVFSYGLKIPYGILG